MSSASASSSGAAGSGSSRQPAGHRPSAAAASSSFSSSSSSVAPPLGPDASLVSAIAPAPFSTPAVVVSVDFGTALCGYAFAEATHLEGVERPASRIECGTFAGATAGQKTKTAVLMDAGSLECIKFGEEAGNYYSHLDDQERKGYYYYQRFKMSLYEQQGVGGSRLSKATKIKSADGREVSAISVFSASLAYLRNEAMTHLTSRALDLSERDVRWVLTVPAIWSEAAKQIMLEAAHLAEMSNVVLALEPEAASVLVRHEREVSVKAPFPIGTVYMVLDCGGGTIDVTVHETLTVTKPGEKDKPAQVKEVYKASGDAFGSTYINAAFEHVLDDIFGADFMSSYQVQYPSGWLQLLNKFEDIKVATKAEVNLRDVKKLELPISFVECVGHKQKGTDAHNLIDTLIDNYLQTHSQQMNALFDSLHLNKHEPLGYHKRSQSLQLSQAFMHSLIIPVVDKAVAHVQGVLSDPQSGPISHIFLVGGFAECPLLYKRAVEQLQRKGVAGQPDRLVIRPSFPGLTVMKGAVVYGLHPTITHRIMRHTYGVQCDDVWSDDKYGPEHLPRQYRDEKGTLRCGRVLGRFVRAGDTVQVDIPKLRGFVPCDRGRTMEVRVLRSLKRDARFTEECELCAKIPIRLPPANADNSNDRGVTVRMFFGENIRVQLQVNATNVIEEAVIDFLA